MARSINRQELFQFLLLELAQREEGDGADFLAEKFEEFAEKVNSQTSVTDMADFLFATYSEYIRDNFRFKEEEGE
jgi:hypothetical protein